MTGRSIPAAQDSGKKFLVSSGIVIFIADLPASAQSQADGHEEGKIFKSFFSQSMETKPYFHVFLHVFSVSRYWLWTVWCSCSHSDEYLCAPDGSSETKAKTAPWSSDNTAVVKENVTLNKLPWYDDYSALITTNGFLMLKLASSIYVLDIRPKSVLPTDF